MSASAADVARNAGLDTGDLDLSDVSVRLMQGWMTRLLGPGVAAITLSNTIHVTPERYEAVVRGEEPALLQHELVHVAQWRREGIPGFLMQYLKDYFRNRLIGLDHDIAYRAIGFEAAAYDLSERPNQDVM